MGQQSPPFVSGRSILARSEVDVTPGGVRVGIQALCGGGRSGARVNANVAEIRLVTLLHEGPRSGLDRIASVFGKGVGGRGPAGGTMHSPIAFAATIGDQALNYAVAI